MEADDKIADHEYEMMNNETAADRKAATNTGYFPNRTKVQIKQ